jgi:hypothetical protein
MEDIGSEEVLKVFIMKLVTNNLSIEEAELFLLLGPDFGFGQSRKAD